MLYLPSDAADSEEQQGTPEVRQQKWLWYGWSDCDEVTEFCVYYRLNEEWDLKTLNLNYHEQPSLIL